MRSDSILVMDLDQTGPIHADLAPLSQAPVEPSGGQAWHTAMPVRARNVLIVDDVAMNRDIAAHFLRAAGHRVICLDGGVAAVVAVASTDYDVVLMDVRMPEMDGLEATRHIRALGGTRGHVPILALTAQAFDEQVMECRKAGMNGHIPKPFDAPTLVTAVTRALESGSHGDNFAPGLPSASSSLTTPVTYHADLPILEGKVFQRTVSALTTEAAASYLDTVATLCGGLLRMLHRTAAVAPTASQLAAAAHTVAASAGMFGFERLTATARQFQLAVEAGAPQVPTLMDALGAVISTSLRELHGRAAAL
jgi:CheY-like chemotaxis protein/HPt (histidine-containing phosphotransfer) domain-containing protein